MVRRVSLRLLVAVLLALTGVAFGLERTERAARAAPPEPGSISISGGGLAEPLLIRQESDPALYGALLEQVSHLHGSGQPVAPKAADLGPKYTVVVLAGADAKQTFDLYPLAKGGPRAYRPARQPQRKTSAAWFFGRLSMSETLRTAGAPLPAQQDTVSGGIGGGERVIQDESLGAGEDLDQIFAELRRLMLLNGAVLLTITVGLAGIALLVRRRTR